MKSVLIICLKSAKVTSKQCLSAILINLFFRVNLFKVIHSVERRNSWNFYDSFYLTNESLMNVFERYWWSSFWKTSCRCEQLIIVVTLVKIIQTKRSEKWVYQKSIDSWMDTWLHACSWLLPNMFKSLVISFVLFVFYSLSAFCLRKVSTIKSKQLSTKRCSKFVLLCTAETDRVRKQMRKLA